MLYLLLLFLDQQEVAEDFELNPERKELFKKRQAFGMQNQTPGTNLVKNRRSLNVESNRKRDDQIRVDNRKLLDKLSSLKPSINTT